jgi:hypothetical protein
MCQCFLIPFSIVVRYNKDSLSADMKRKKRQRMLFTEFRFDVWTCQWPQNMALFDEAGLNKETKNRQGNKKSRPVRRRIFPLDWHESSSNWLSQESMKIKRAEGAA